MDCWWDDCYSYPRGGVSQKGEISVFILLLLLLAQRMSRETFIKENIILMIRKGERQCNIWSLKRKHIRETSIKIFASNALSMAIRWLTAISLQGKLEKQCTLLALACFESNIVDVPSDTWWLDSSRIHDMNGCIWLSESNHQVSEGKYTILDSKQTRVHCF